MAKVLTVDVDNFKNGLQLLNDDSEAPIGSARTMSNVLITDRGGIAPRPGTELLGVLNNNINEIKGFFVFKKSFGEKEIPIKTFDDEMEAFDETTKAWFRVKDGFTANKEFGFTTSLVNTESEDFTYFSNRFDDYQRWTGQITNLNGALVGAETDITVDSVLEADIFESETAVSTTATEIVIADLTKWTNNQWNSFQVLITSGAQSGKIRTITATDGATGKITFDTLGVDPGGAGTTFEVRQVIFPTTGGTLIIDGTTIVYTGIDTQTTIQVASANAAPDNAPVTLVPETFAGAPRGNRIDVLLGRVFVGNVRSALSRDEGGALQGSNRAGSVFVSRQADPKDFTFSATRIAGQGDILSMPYGGGDITDVSVQEDVAYIYKRRYIESVRYSGDIDDFAIRTPLKPGVGSVHKVIRGKDDHFFFTEDKEFTSIGRVLAKDVTVQTENIGLPIKRLLDNFEFDLTKGAEFRNRLFIAARSGTDTPRNDVTLIFNKTTRTFEGVWDIPAFGFDVFRDELFYAESNGANVYKMLVGKSDVRGLDTFNISTIWQSNFFNLLPIKGNEQSIQSIALEGFITANTTFTFELFKNFESTSTLSFDFGGLDDEEFFSATSVLAFLGANPLGLHPLGTIEDPDEEGRRRFSFQVYFPFQHGQYFSMKFSSSGIDQDWEIIRASLGLRENISTLRSGIKRI